MQKIIVAAKSDHRVIGKDNDLPWHLPADLAFFLQTIADAYLITGRKSYESAQGEEVFGPHRQFAIITRQQHYQPKYGQVAHSLSAALRLAAASNKSKCCILGGATIYEQAMALADTMILTEIHAKFDGDTFFPEIDTQLWKETKRQDFQKDDNNPFDYSFVRYKKRK